MLRDLVKKFKGEAQTAATGAYRSACEQHAKDVEGELPDLLEVLNAAARDLPEGYDIELTVQKGSAWVTLTAPNCAMHDMPDMSTETTLREQIEYLIVFAVNDAAPEVSTAATSSENNPEQPLTL